MQIWFRLANNVLDEKYKWWNKPLIKWFTNLLNSEKFFLSDLSNEQPVQIIY